MLAALMYAPSALKSTRSYLQWMLSKFSPDTAQGRRARLVFFAMQGLFLMEGFGLLPLTATKRKLLVEEFNNYLNVHRR
jgi:hypothetical protein